MKPNTYTAPDGADSLAKTSVLVSSGLKFKMSTEVRGFAKKHKIYQNHKTYWYTERINGQLFSSDVAWESR